MKRFRCLYICGFLLVIFGGDVFAKNQWTSYDNMDCCNSFAFEGNHLWCAEGNAIVHWNGSDGTFIAYTYGDGPSPGWYSSVMIDRKGVKWFGGFTGLNRFDGSSWRTFTTADGLPGNIVKQIAVTGNNTLWIATVTGIGSYDGNAWVKHEFPEENWNFSLMVDDEDRIWVGTGRTVYRSGDGESWEIRSELPENFQRFFSAPDGRKWLTTRNGSLWEYDGGGWALSEELQGYYITTVTPGRDGVVWYGTQGAGVVHRREKEMRNYTIPDGLPSNTVHSAGLDADGRLWLGTSLGLCRFDGSHWEPFLTGGGPVSNYVRGLSVDRRNVLWAATLQGLSAYDGKRWTTDPYLDGLNVIAVAAAPSGVIWAAVQGGDIWRIDGDFRRRFTREDGLTGDDVTSIVVDRDDVAWFGTRRRGVVCYSAGIWKKYTILDGIEDDEITAAAVDSANVKWFGTRYGVSRFDGATWRTYTVRDGLTHNHVNAITVGTDGIVWFATESGLARFDGYAWKKILSGNPLISIVTDRHNRKWAGNAANAVYVMEGENTKQILLNTPSRCIAVDGNDVRWFGSADGILLRMTDNPPVATNSQNQPIPILFRGNRPNPFNASTVLEFTLSGSEYVSLVIYNAAGQKVRELLCGRIEAGAHAIRWDGGDGRGRPASSGMYFARLKTQLHTATIKILLVR